MKIHKTYECEVCGVAWTDLKAMAEHEEQCKPLLPCPFCGGKATEGWGEVRCSKCQIRGPRAEEGDDIEARKSWNSRAELTTKEN